ncbi:MAG TPA: ubiquitin-like small modifier protein 1 [Vicinamibacterales bacterium]|nr:ubiquitin-like small modifier protein 1 [Vicinamibacterales bacterium]
MKSITFALPGQLRQFAGGEEELRLRGNVATLSDALSLLFSECPAVRDRIVTERGDVRPHINIFLDGENTRHAGGLAAPVQDGAEIVILPAVSGGTLEKP